MKYKSTKSLAAAIALIPLLSMPNGANAQERGFFSAEPKETEAKVAPAAHSCTGPVTRVIDVGFEGMKKTSAVFGTNPGGGEGGQFDKVPLLTTQVQLAEGACLDAHLSAIVGSKQTYGRLGVSNLALFQVTLTPAAGLPQHMFGHYQTPYGVASPAVALEAERDVDMLAANFFQGVGNPPQNVPPGVYTVDVWWAGAPPNAPGGAIGFAFVLKLYVR